MRPAEASEDWEGEDWDDDDEDDGDVEVIYVRE